MAEPGRRPGCPDWCTAHKTYDATSGQHRSAGRNGKAYAYMGGRTRPSAVSVRVVQYQSDSVVERARLRVEAVGLDVELTAEQAAFLAGSLLDGVAALLDVASEPGPVRRG